MSTPGGISPPAPSLPAIYWSCLAPLPVRFSRQDVGRVPAHWLTVGTRGSPLSGGPRVAITPVNAILNYLYAILEAETRIACLTLGLDPGLGVWHADYRSRDSFVLDLMEVARPTVDQYVLHLIQTRTFTRKDVGETSRGVCRLLAPLATELAQTASLWREAIAPHAEHVAGLLADTPGSRVERLPTPLTSRMRKAANPTRRARRPPVVRPPSPVPQCKACGDPVPKRDRVYCDTCITGHQRHTDPEQAARPAATANEPSLVTTSDGQDAEGRPRTSRTCKRCGSLVSHHKRVLCDPCFEGSRLTSWPSADLARPAEHVSRTASESIATGA